MIEQMIDGVKEKIELAYANAIERKVDHPVVFVLDLRDEGASWVAERFTEPSRIDDIILESEKRGTAPLLTFAVSHKQAGLLLGQLNPDSAQSLESTQLPDTHFLALGIADGKIVGRALERP